jgi:hypothetical protein
MSEVSPGRGSSESTVDAQIRRCVALLAIATGLIHLWITPEHFGESTRYGVFFIVCAVAQLLLAVAVIVAPRPLVLLGGAMGTATLVCVYVVSHTVGIGVGAHRHSEEVSVLDLVAVATEVLGIGLLLALLTGARRRWAGNLLLAAGTALFLLRAARA